AETGRAVDGAGGGGGGDTARPEGPAASGGRGRRAGPGGGGEGLLGGAGLGLLGPRVLAGRGPLVARLVALVAVTRGGGCGLPGADGDESLDLLAVDGLVLEQRAGHEREAVLVLS